MQRTSDSRGARVVLMLSSLKRLAKRWLVDHPGLLSGSLILIPTIWWTLSLTHCWTYDWVVHPSNKQGASVVVAVYLGLAGVSAISGGFAGVIIVFGLTPQSDI